MFKDLMIFSTITTAAWLVERFFSKSKSQIMAKFDCDKNEYSRLYTIFCNILYNTGSRLVGRKLFTFVFCPFFVYRNHFTFFNIGDKLTLKE